MEHSPLLGPVVALVAWTLVMMVVDGGRPRAGVSPHGDHPGDHSRRRARLPTSTARRSRRRSGKPTITCI